MNAFTRLISRGLSKTDAPLPVPDPFDRISLALQGGGAFGAFTWGVLDRLLEADGPAFDSISGASAGAVNAVLVAAGLAEGGREGARAKLRAFWTEAVKQAPSGLLGGFAQTRATLAFDLSSRLLSPYQLNPLGLNPLRALLSEHVDFGALREAAPLRLLIGATKVSDGSLRVFTEAEVSVDVVLASTCLPLLHHAVEIDGEAYWDGGYAANPPLLPLVEASEAATILLVQIMPREGEVHPTTSPAIVKRLNQITFSRPLTHEVEAITAMKRLVAGGELADGPARKLAELRLESVAADEWVPDLKSHSTLELERRFVTELHERGREAGAAWLASLPRQTTRRASAA